MTSSPPASRETTSMSMVMRKYDKESNTRVWEGIPKVVVTAIMVLYPSTASW